MSRILDMSKEYVDGHPQKAVPENSIFQAVQTTPDLSDSLANGFINKYCKNLRIVGNLGDQIGSDRSIIFKCTNGRQHFLQLHYYYS